MWVLVVFVCQKWPKRTTKFNNQTYLQPGKGPETSQQPTRKNTWLDKSIGGKIKRKSTFMVSGACLLESGYTGFYLSSNQMYLFCLDQRWHLKIKASFVLQWREERGREEEKKVWVKYCFLDWQNLPVNHGGVFCKRSFLQRVISHAWTAAEFTAVEVLGLRPYFWFACQGFEPSNQKI